MRRGAAAEARKRSPFGRKLPREFYSRETEVVARDLLGAVLCVGQAHALTAGRIVETEAYVGEHDGACHAAAGLTPRTRPLYGPPCTAYVYFVYGMYWCVNAVTRRAGLPSAVLIRAVEPLEGLELIRGRRPSVRRTADLANGPGKLCLAMGIDGSLNGESLLSHRICIREGDPVSDGEVEVTPRIGITKAVDWPLRYIVRDSQYLSARAR